MNTLSVWSEGEFHCIWVVFWELKPQLLMFVAN